MRYSIAAFMGFHYGIQILRFFSQYYKPAMAILIGLAMIGAVMTIIQYFRYRKQHPSHARA